MTLAVSVSPSALTLLPGSSKLGCLVSVLERPCCFADWAPDFLPASVGGLSAFGCVSQKVC